MASKKKRNPKTNWRKVTEYATAIVGFVCILAFAAFFFIEATHNYKVYQSLNSDIYTEYTGTYEMFRWGKNHASFAMQLENGDTVLIRSHTCENRVKFSETDQIHVKYSPYKDPILQGYTPICITSADGSIVFVNAETQKSEARIFILFYILAAAFVAWLIMLLGLGIHEKRLARKYLSHPQKKKRKPK